MEGFPPVVYVPCTRHTADVAELEVRHQTTQDGRRAVLVYSALDRLQTCCGEDQPWFLLPSRGLQAMHDLDPFDLVLMDMLVLEKARAGLRA